MDTPPPFISSIPRFVQLFFARPLWYGIDPYLWQLWMNSHGSDRDRPRKRMFQSKMWKIWKLCSSQLSLVATWADLLSYLMASICFYWTDCAFCGKNFGSGNSHGDFHHGVLLQPGFEKMSKRTLDFCRSLGKSLVKRNLDVAVFQYALMMLAGMAPPFHMVPLMFSILNCNRGPFIHSSPFRGSLCLRLRPSDSRMVCW